MDFYVGQRVRFLHEDGEGVVTEVVDRHNIEVDLGDDFPVNYSHKELIPIDQAEGRFHAVEELEEEAHGDTIRRLGNQLFELSLVISLDLEHQYELRLVNPEGYDALYTLHSKIRHKYKSLSNGKVKSGASQLLCRLSKDQLSSTREFYFQVLLYKEGSGPPHVPLTKAIRWKGNMMDLPMKEVEAINQKGWILGLREEQSSGPMEELTETEFVSVKADDLVKNLVKEVDLHIEELVEEVELLSREEMFSTQLQAINKALSDALLHNYERLVFIHGVGEGHLRNELSQILRKTPHVKRYGLADPLIYGNGATEVFFR